MFPGMLRRPKDHEGTAASWKITLACPPLRERRIATGWLPHGESASDRAPTATSARWLVLGAGQAAGRDEPGAKFSGIVAGEVSIRRWPFRSGSEGRP